jgi:hypothetical protein
MTEAGLRRRIAAVRTGRLTRRRDLIGKPSGLGLTAPFAARLPAQAGMAHVPAPFTYMPTQRGGGGALRPQRA